MILGPSFERVRSFAELMSKGAVSVPKHLRGNMGDCMAITIQALGWNMNPFAVAQKTHLSQGGALGYESQLVSAVLVSTGAIQGEPEYIAVGDWSRVLGKVEEREGKKRDDGTGGGKYYIATYTKKDEEGLGVTVRATLKGGKSRDLTVMMSQAYPRFSTQWATDPFQQLCYLGVRKWGRLNAPGAILGVYTPDELDGGAPLEKFMGPVEIVKPAATTLPTWPEDKFAERLPKWMDAIRSGKTVDGVITAALTKGVLTDDQLAQIKALPAQIVKELEPRKPEGRTGPAVTYAQVADAMIKAPDMDKLNDAATLINAIEVHAQQDQLNALYDKRAAELN